jgi:hypothetical protein
MSVGCWWSLQEALEAESQERQNALGLLTDEYTALEKQMNQKIVSVPLCTHMAAMMHAWRSAGYLISHVIAFAQMPG